MRILIISTVRFRANGISKVIENFYCNDLFLKDQLYFIFPEDSEISMIDRVKRFGKVFQVSRKNQAQYFNFIKKLVKEKNIQILHIHGNSHSILLEMIAAKAGGCKVRIAHSHNTTCNHKVIHFLLSPLFILSCTDRFSCGHEAGTWMFGKKEFKVIHNGIDIEGYSFSQINRNVIRQKYAIGERVCLLGHVGNLNSQKNQIYILDILSSLLQAGGEYRLILVGEGTLKDSIKKRAKELCILEYIIFAGVTNNVSAYLSAMDMIVMPSLYEGLPLALIEEQANGLDCVVADTITLEVDKTGNVCFLPLEKPQLWVSEIDDRRRSYDITSRKKKSVDAIERITNAGYNVAEERERLRKYYADALCRVSDQ